MAGLLGCSIGSSSDTMTLASRFLVLSLAAALLFVLGVIICRPTLHPLSSYPGPILAKITSWHDVYHAYRGNKHLNFHRLHQRYGPIVRYAPNAISINHPNGLKAIYSHKANTRKSDFYTAFPAAKGVYSTHTAIERNMHARKRRVMSNAFSDGALKGMEEYVLVHVREWIAGLTNPSSPSKIESQSNGHANGTLKPSESWTEPRDIGTLSSYLGFDVMGDLSFGKSFDMLTSPRNRHAIQLLCQAARRHNITGAMPALAHSGLDKYLFPKIYHDRKKYLAFSRAQVGERIKAQKQKEEEKKAERRDSGNGLVEKPKERKDFYYYLLRSKDPETGEGFSQRELWGESNTLIIAGSDTTSTTLAATLFYLLHDSSAKTRLVEEIRSAFESQNDITSGPKLNACHWLRACIDEALRMSPPVGTLLPRTVLPGGLSLEIDGKKHQLPEGTEVGVPIYAIHHHEDYVETPFEYKPDRWLKSSASTSDLQKLHSIFNPFSVGPRGCIGKPLAYLELSLALARLVYSYDMELASGDLGHAGEGRKGLGYGRERQNEYQLEDIFVSDKEGPFGIFRPRTVAA